jgi:hypothetical protein
MPGIGVSGVGRGGSRLLLYGVIKGARELGAGPPKDDGKPENGAWPYLDPHLLDLRQGEGRLDVMRWPRTKNGRPIFIQVASLSFHYGPEVVASRHSLIWFRGPRS